MMTTINYPPVNPVQFAGQSFNKKIKSGLAIGAFSLLPLFASPTKVSADNVKDTVEITHTPKKDSVDVQAFEKQVEQFTVDLEAAKPRQIDQETLQELHLTAGNLLQQCEQLGADSEACKKLQKSLDELNQINKMDITDKGIVLLAVIASLVFTYKVLQVSIKTGDKAIDALLPAFIKVGRKIIDDQRSSSHDEPSLEISLPTEELSKRFEAALEQSKVGEKLNISKKSPLKYVISVPKEAVDELLNSFRQLHKNGYTIISVFYFLQ